MMTKTAWESNDSIEEEKNTRNKCIENIYIFFFTINNKLRN